MSSVRCFKKTKRVSFMKIERSKSVISMTTAEHRTHGSKLNLPSGNEVGEPVTPLMLACQQGDINQIRRIVTKQPSTAKEKDASGRTALHYCPDGAGTPGAEILLRAAPDLVHATDREGHTALHLAVTGSSRSLARCLLQHGASANVADLEGHTPVHWSTVCGDLEIMDQLLDNNGDVSCQDNNGAYPIHYAAQMCGPNSDMLTDVKLGLATLKKLVARGADVTVRDNDGRTPLLWAASAETRPSKLYSVSGSADALLVLVKAGASVRDIDKDGLSALHCAASRGHTDCVDTLVSLCGAPVNPVDCTGCTPLFYAVTLGHADCTELLIEHSAWLNHQDHRGRTAAHCGAAKGQLETMKMLHRHGANLWMTNIKGDLPLHEAVASGRVELVRWLLQLRPSAVNQSNSQGRCSLHVATINDNIEMCKVLIDLNANVNSVMRSSRGQLMTPLDSALFCGNRSCARYLQLHGAVPASTLGPTGPALAASVAGVKLSESQTENSFVLPPEEYLRLSADILNSSHSSNAGLGAVDGAVQTDWSSKHNISTQVDRSRRHKEKNIVSSKQTLGRHSSTDRLRNERDDGQKENQRRRYLRELRTKSCSDLESRTREEDYFQTQEDPFYLSGYSSSSGTDDKFEKQTNISKSNIDKNDASRNFRAKQRRKHANRTGNNFHRPRDNTLIHARSDEDKSIPGRAQNTAAKTASSVSPEKYIELDRKSGTKHPADEFTSTGRNKHPHRLPTLEQESALTNTTQKNSNLKSPKTGVTSRNDETTIPGSISSNIAKQQQSFRKQHVTTLESDLPSRPILRSTKKPPSNSSKSSVEKRISKDLLEIKRIELRPRNIDEGKFVKRLAENFNSFAMKNNMAIYSGQHKYGEFEAYLNAQLNNARAVKEPKNSGFMGRYVAEQSTMNFPGDKQDLKEIPPFTSPRTNSRCHHVVHAYTGIPCAAYIKRQNHHCIVKPTTKTILPKIDPLTKLPEPVDLQSYDPSKPLKLELNHAGERQTIELPTHLLDKKQKYQVSFSIRPDADSQQKNATAGDDDGTLASAMKHTSKP